MTPEERSVDLGSLPRRPTFFMVGASRAGTTSLWDYLGQHPDVFFPPDPFPKEPSHFCDLTPVWAHRYRDVEAYLEGYRGAEGAKALGDASTTYLPSPESPQRIRDRIPDARIIISLRNPADRAFSLYSLLCQLGFEWITPFERALEAEDERLGNEAFARDNPFWYHAYLYFHSGLYAEQVERYLKTFGPEQVKIVLFEAIKRKPVETAQEIFRFLEVDPTFEPSVEVRNQSAFPLSVLAQRAITRVWKTHPMKGSDRPPSLVDRALHVAARANLTLGRRRRQRLAPETRRMLLRRYEADIRRTGSLVGIDLEPWIRGEPVPVG
jgi:hypothetical protein